MIMQTAKIHRDTVKGIAGSIDPAHREKASRLTAVKVSTPYTARDTKRKTYTRK
jgi:hypothetical protein